MTVRLMIVDDQPLIRAAVAALLDGSAYAVVAGFGDAHVALVELNRVQPDLVILETAMQGGMGLDLLHGMRAGGYSGPVIVFTSQIDGMALGEAEALGISAFVMKNDEPEKLIECLETVWAGGCWADPQNRLCAVDLDTRSTEIGLSSRERRMIALVAQGMRNREIAAQLGITEGTVKVYLHGIFGKTGVANRTELAVRATQSRIRT